MDKNGKIGGKVSIIDILVVVLVVAVIVGIVALLTHLRKKARLQIKSLKKTWAKLLMYRLKMQHCSQQQRRVNLKTLNCPEDILAM